MNVFVDVSEVVIESMLSLFLLAFLSTIIYLYLSICILSYIDLPKLEIFYSPSKFSLEGKSNYSWSHSRSQTPTNEEHQSQTLTMRSMYLEKSLEMKLLENLLLDLPSLWYFVSENAFRNTEHVLIESKIIRYLAIE